MMTWFDALLVTGLGLLTALGARQGLAGAAWGLAAIAACWLCNQLSGWPALGLALALGAVTTRLSQRFRAPAELPWWQAALGGAAGFLFGLVLTSALTLSLPLRAGQAYPDADGTGTGLRDAVRNSYIQRALRGAWHSAPLKSLLLPDQRAAGHPEH